MATKPYIPGRGHKKQPEDMHWSAARNGGHQLTAEQRAKKQAYERDYARRTGRYKTQYEKTGRTAHRLRLYGLTPEKYQEISEAQNHACLICGGHKDSFERGLVIDHNHATGQVRALLCDNCNKAIGCMGESPERLLAAADYLGRF